MKNLYFNDSQRSEMCRYMKYTQATSAHSIYKSSRDIIKYFDGKVEMFLLKIKM